jgi:outer membrane lipoprotein-sorting protein
VARYVSARGGLKKIRAVETLRQTGSITSGAGRTARAVRELKRPGKTRFEFTVQGVTGVYVSDGRTGWQVNPFEGRLEPAPLPEEVVAEAAEQADLEGPLVDWKAKGHKVELAGREKVAGKDAYKLKVTLKSGAIRQEYVDVATGRLVRSDATRQVRGHAVATETTFSDFKRSGGVLFPRRIEVQAVGRPQRMTIVVDKVEVNPALPDARFTKPAGLP